MKTSKTMTVYGALHPSDADRVHLPRGKGGREMTGCETCIRSEENNLAWYTKKFEKKLMLGVHQAKILSYDYSKQKTEYWQKTELKKRWKSKEKTNGIYAREMLQTADEDETWERLRKIDFKKLR